MSKVAFMFPGQGSLEEGMGREIVEAVPEAMAVFRDGSEAAGIDLSKLCFDTPLVGARRDGEPAAGARRDEPRDQRGDSRARDRAGLRRRPFGRRVRGARRGAVAHAGGGDRARARARPRDGGGGEGAAGHDGRDPRARGRGRRDASATRSRTCGPRTTTAPGRSSSRARPAPSKSAARRPSRRARGARSGCASRARSTARSSSARRSGCGRRSRSVHFKEPLGAVRLDGDREARERAALPHAARRAAHRAGEVHAGGDAS